MDLLDAAGNPIGSLPAHPVDLGGSTTDATGLWLGKEAVFWIRRCGHWLFGQLRGVGPGPRDRDVAAAAR